MNTDMILNEPIINVLEMDYTEGLQKHWQNSCLYVNGTFEYHVTEGYWLVFETENYYATIGYDGVKTYKKPYEFPKDKFYLWQNDDEWIDYKQTLFEGQKIHSVEKHEDYQTVYFDDFKLEVYVYDETDDFNLCSAMYGDGINAMTVGGHLLEKCECGGDGELLCDERSDYAVRCKACHKSTYFDMILKYQIDDWNNGDTPCVIQTGREKLMDFLSKKKINYIALSSSPYGFKKIDETFCYCSEAIICFDNAFINIASQKVEGYNFDFAGNEYTDYNRDFWSNVITPQDKISFVGEEEDWEGRKGLRFKLDDVELLIKATSCGLSVEIDEEKLILSQGTIKRTRLFN